MFGIPTYGTMAHSFIQSFDDEAAAFGAFARARPDNLVLLIDTYDTEAAARKLVVSRSVQFNDKLIAFAKHWGFQPRACAPYRARPRAKRKAASAM
jgi:nicotinic acid phosphoribosyltransferase